MTNPASIDNNVAALLAQGAADFGTAQANTGEGIQGQWPPEGLCDLFVLDLTEKVGKFVIGRKGEAGFQELPCIECQFTYQVMADTKDNPNAAAVDPTKPGLVFQGERFQLLPGYQKLNLAENQQTRARIQWDRFKGHVATILNMPKDQISNDLPALFTAMKSRISQPNRLGVQAKIQYREYERAGRGNSAPVKGLNKTEFLLENITDAGAAA